LQSWDLLRNQQQFHATVAKCADVGLKTGESTEDCAPTNSTAYPFLFQRMLVESKIVRRYINPQEQFENPSQALYTAEHNEFNKLAVDKLTTRYFSVSGNWNYFCGSRLATIKYFT
jgi:hypothetical protein